MKDCKSYLETILEKSEKYLKKHFKAKEYKDFLQSISYIKNIKDKKEVVKFFEKHYYKFIKELYQAQYKYDEKLENFLQEKEDKKIIWGDCLRALRLMKSESISCMVTSPPYYNARNYAKWKNLDEYFKDMEKILKECYRVLDNHRVFVFNVGDIFDNDNLFTSSTWGKRRLPLGAYFIILFEKIGFTFVDDIIWDKGEVQSQRHKNGNKPYPYYQYPMNCYEHILIFHKHRLDENRYPCPVCGCLQVNGNAYTERGLKSWECKNLDCFERSKANRGKRFSAKTFITQNDENNIKNEISKDFIYAWRRDIKKINPVIKINSKGQNILGHSAPFPTQIPEFAVRMFSYKGERVLDPFAGLGTSIIVASKLGRVGIGIERDLSTKEYVYNFLGKENLKEFIL
ncbi:MULTISPECIES: DNA-methyltransferase [unclassified Campylobacter]|uniref:DNA-methyltransferase n=1 Tax=unclassified Campylobacter TaxID=2593542 RepID=UPI001237F982|nr:MULTISPECIES: site-specific DNA-methyltransferase [unclassified Campylobacter]KAA6227210.1 site-specific DNA-methyltransferase [Campylobacter sp. LR286c]KAA6227916.1 site-specific DNA-methyltransferase [Campylobacter sp. LR185c]KAA6228325.1 site-specific DNA-methyltransferase [Campylobacter sp. LR196d]KAA6229326.1 site-specific DNA-methyltransferase [Campylobacter sp. LR291e]KAA6231132.1 site-specific DNA-methyltransferase [Campylobacter sp. LR264d]